MEWIAAEPWRDGNVGMDGGSYLAMTQLTAAAAAPPHLKCIIPSVPTADPFREVPYFGGGFSRQHTLSWTRLIATESLAELDGGLGGLSAVLTRPEWYRRMTVRPVLTAADDLLSGDQLQHYRDVLAHPTLDAWWQERTLGLRDWAAIGIPTLVVSGSFDLSIGAVTVWRGLEAHGSASVPRQLLIGPWDHSGAYVGGTRRSSPFHLANGDAVDPFTVRLAFLDLHLRGRGNGPDLGGRVTVFLTGANEWRSFDAFPPPGARVESLFLRSGGHANGSRGDGTLDALPPAGSEPADRFADDPELPFVAAMSHAGNYQRDLRERARCSDTLVYRTRPLEQPLTMLGEAEAVLSTTADCPDADLAGWIAEERPDGSLVQLTFGHLRLRYREGFDREVLLEPGAVVPARIRFHYVGHRVAAGSALVLLVSRGNFPWIDPNPHTGEPIATAPAMRPAMQTVFHDPARQSRVEIPVI